MSNFFRSGFGKMLLFLTCVLSVITLAVSGFGAYYALREADSVYGSSTKDEFISDLFLRELRYEGYGPVYEAGARESGSGSVVKIGNNGNVLMKVVNDKGETVALSSEATAETDFKYEIRYAYIEWDEGEHRGSDVIWLENDSSAMPYSGDPDIGDVSFYTVYFGFKRAYPEFDQYRLISKYGPEAFKLRYAVYGIAGGSLLLMILSFVGLMLVSARRPGKEKVYPGVLNGVPFDVLLVVTAVLCFGAWYLVDSLDSIGVTLQIIAAAAAALFTLVCFIGLCMGLASRLKQGDMLRKTLIARIILFAVGLLGAIWGLLKKIVMYFAGCIRGLPVAWKTVLGYLLFSVFELVMIMSVGWGDDQAIFLCIERAVLFPAVVYLALTLRKLRDSGEALAAGDLSHYTDTSKMIGDFKKHGEDLNNLSVGMARAVEDRMKSEHMKTELITNVSHDIKTPLTSIINYATLIGEEHSENEKINEYSEVLVRQSERLKRLIDDLVEASKASTGNIDVEPVPCDASVFIDQIAGEYTEKLAAADLTLVTKVPEQELRIMADGRRMWRIFDNLMSNIFKYALPGTRVYLSLEEDGDDAVFTFKNTSREELNISEEELMERFTRGDSSRNTEGNGLGLSIARSMAEVQGGTLDLSIDGDLFKAILRFPKI